jgi:hypothetical protein
MDLKDVGLEIASWIQLAQDREQRRALVDTVIHFPVPLNSRNLLIN